MIYYEIKKRCEEKNIAVYKLEEALGLSRGSVCKWDLNKPAVTKVKAVAEYLGCTIDDLVKEERRQ